MPSILTFRRGTSAQNNAFTGSAGEITVDTTNGTLRVHDGVTAGGSQLATQSYVTTQLGTLGNLATEDTISSSLLADGAVTATKLASTLDLTGKTVTLPAGVGGSWIKLASGQVTSEIASITYTGFTSTYDHYVFVMESLGTANSGGVNPRLRLTNSSGTKSDSNYKWTSMHPYVTSGGGLSNVHASWSDTFFGIHGSNAIRGSENNSGVSGQIHFYRPFDSTKRTTVTFQSIGIEQDESQINGHIGGGYYMTAESNTGFTFFFSTDNVRSGSYAVYGVAK